MTDISADVAIIGYGPVGATLAKLLGQFGLSVVVVEKERTVFDKPRAIGIDHESLRTLQLCGLGSELPKLISAYRGGTYLGADGLPILELVQSPPPYLLGWPPNAHFIQPELEACLRRAAESHVNVRVKLGTELVGFQQGAGFTTLDLNNGERLTAKYVMACDGANSFVRRKLGVTFEDLGFDEWWVVVDAWLKDQNAVPTTSRQYCSPSRPGTYVIGPRNLRRWEFKLLPGEVASDYHDHNRVLSALRRYVDVDAIDIWRTAVYRFHALVANTWRDHNIFLVGDAAHQTPPFLGQGMNSGIRDAANLAWKILAVEKSGANPAILCTYEQERRPHFRSVVERSKQQGLIIGELDKRRARDRDVKMRKEAEQRGTLGKTRQSYIPALNSGIIDKRQSSEQSALAGTLFPQPSVRLKSGETGLLDDLLGMNFVVAFKSFDFTGWLTEHTRDALRDLNARIVLFGDQRRALYSDLDFLLVEDVDGLMTSWWMDKETAAIIARPDRYIYAAASSAEQLSECIDHLHGTMKRLA